MKNLFFSSILVIAALFSSCGNEVSDSETVSVEINNNHIAVHDFHVTHRCETCINIEEATIETLDNNFKNELENETIVLHLIDADAEENQTLAEEYGAYGSTLAITIFKDGEKEIIDITNWAFDAVHGDNFEPELTDKIKDALAKL
jgi:hypothetical protein